jgi:hypothetical protein
VGIARGHGDPKPADDPLPLQLQENGGVSRSNLETVPIPSGGVEGGYLMELAWPRGEKVIPLSLGVGSLPLTSAGRDQKEEPE